MHGLSRDDQTGRLMLMYAKADAAKGAQPRAAGEVLVAAKGVTLAFRGKPAVETVSIAVHACEIVTLIGPNGAGKTTLARALLGLAPVTQAGASDRLRATALSDRSHHSAFGAAFHVAERGGSARACRGLSG